MSSPRVMARRVKELEDKVKRLEKENTKLKLLLKRQHRAGGHVDDGDGGLSSLKRIWDTIESDKGGSTRDPSPAAADLRSDSTVSVSIPKWSRDQREKKKRNAERVKQEIVTTERTYCIGLERILAHFKYPLQGKVYFKDTVPEGEAMSSVDAKSMMVKRVASRSLHDSKSPDNRERSPREKAVMQPGDVAAVFSNVELISQLNHTFLRNLEAGEKDVGIIIADFAQYFKMYMPYVQNHEGATETLKALCKSSKKFRKALAKYEEEAKCSLQSLLILPIQRIPRYKLLLETLIKNTHPHDKSYAPLNKALSDIRKSASHINSSIEEREASKKLTELQAMFTGHITLVAPSRKYIMNQTMNKLTKGGALQERQFFLFTDMLLYATDDVTFSDKLRVRQMMPIDKSFLLSDLNRKGHMLYVASSVKNVTISFASNEDLEKWKAALTQCMENQRNKIGFNYNDRSHLAKGSKSPRRDEKKDLGPVFTSYSYGYAAEEKSKEDLEFYEQMRHVETTRRYFDTLQKQTKLYLQEQLTLVKVATAFAHKLEGDDKILLSRAMWYRAMAAIATMVAVHSHEMLRWKSVTELLIDSISWLLNEPIKDALALKKEYAKRCYELQQAKKNSEKAAYKKNPKPERVQAAFQAVLGAEKAFETAKNDAIEGCNTMDSAIKRGFVDKLKLFVRVQTDYHKDCYYDIRRCWEQIRKSEEEVKAFDAARVRAAREEKARLEAEANTPKSIDENKPSVKLRLSEVSTRSST